jgi:hypothetical protein
MRKPELKKRKIKLLLLITLTFLTTPVFNQSLKKTKEDLLKQFKKIFYWFFSKAYIIHTSSCKTTK